MVCDSLVGNFRDVRVGFQVGKDVIRVPTGQIAKASIDPQDLAGKARPLWTLEGDIDCPGLVGDAAPVVHADSTVLGPVGVGADAACQSEVDGHLWLENSQTLLPFLQEVKGAPS